MEYTSQVQTFHIISLVPVVGIEFDPDIFKDVGTFGNIACLFIWYGIHTYEDVIPSPV